MSSAAFRVEVRAESTASPQALWAVVASPLTWPERTDTINTLTPRRAAARVETTRVEVGARFRLRRPGSRAMTWTVTRVERGALLRWEARVLGARTTVEYGVSPTDEGAALSATYTQDGPLAGVLGGLGGNHHALVLEREVAALAASAAAEAGGMP